MALASISSLHSVFRFTYFAYGLHNDSKLLHGLQEDAGDEAEREEPKAEEVSES